MCFFFCGFYGLFCGLTVSNTSDCSIPLGKGKTVCSAAAFTKYETY